MSIVRENLMKDKTYSPYCGRTLCFNRTTFDGKQFKCSCGWKSEFPDDFIKEYKSKWNK